MAIDVVGNRIIKAIKTGRDAGKTIITEQVGNVTLTKVLNSEGKEIVNRAKKIERFKVGDKDVVRRTDVKKVDVFTRFNPQEGRSFGFKTILDRVFSGGEYKGGRLIEYKPESCPILSGKDPLTYIDNSVKYITKGSTAQYVNFVKQQATNGITFHKKYNCNSSLKAANLKPQYRSSLTSPERKEGEEIIKIGQRSKEDEKFFSDINQRTHNDHGLPMPKRTKENEKLLDYTKMREMSLKDMRREWFETTKGATEYTSGMNLDALNNVRDFTLEKAKDASTPLNDLAKYL